MKWLGNKDLWKKGMKELGGNLISPPPPIFHEVFATSLVELENKECVESSVHIECLLMSPIFVAGKVQDLLTTRSQIQW